MTHTVDNYHLLTYDSIDSTNEEAKRLALSGGQHGAVCWAKKQTHGKGRMGREWVSEEGNLYCSFLLKPKHKIADFAQMSFVAALAVAEALNPVFEGKAEVQLKWPNDILLNGKKLGGILLETVKPESKSPWIIVGIGINIEHFPQDTALPATSLIDAGVEVISAKIILSRIVNCFFPLMDKWEDKGFASIKAGWENLAAYKDEKVTFVQHNTSYEGIFKGINDDGQCVIMLENGDTACYHAGDMSLRKVHAVGH
jgi:BirA family transcriptional regulator, biotin operon repressor / biotin---[acetyl-CoA-carboxylase] ligase